MRSLEQGQTPLLSTTGEEDDYEDPTATPKLSMGLKSSTTPILSVRDELGLNKHDDDGASVGGSTFASSNMSIRDLAREERRAAKRARKELEDALAALPAPQFEYELSAPMFGDHDDVQVETVPQDDDQADLDSAALERRRKEAESKSA